MLSYKCKKESLLALLEKEWVAEATHKIVIKLKYWVKAIAAVHLHLVLSKELHR